MKIRQHEDPQWIADRVGKVTASKIADVMAKTKSGYSASRKNYLAQLALERITGEKDEGYTNAAMQWGIDTEPEARAAFEFQNDVIVEEVLFIPHPTIPDSGASPDGLIGDLEMIEIKCPTKATHMDFLLTKKIPQKYLLQMQWQMACAEREVNYFVSFDPRFPVEMQMLTVTIERDDKLIQQIENEVRSFLDELYDTVIKLRKEYGSEA